MNGWKWKNDPEKPENFWENYALAIENIYPPQNNKDINFCWKAATFLALCFSQQIHLATLIVLRRLLSKYASKVKRFGHKISNIATWYDNGLAASNI